MDRRSFLKLLGLAGAAVGVGAVSLEVMPSPAVMEAAAEIEGISVAEFDALCRKYITPQIIDAYFKEDPLHKMLRRQSRS